MSKNNQKPNFFYQKALLKQNCPFIECKVSLNRKVLTCEGMFKPTDDTDKYRVKIICESDKSPQIIILEPRIEVTEKEGFNIHIYPNGSLCLFYPKEFEWTNNTTVAENLIPWINEWILYYEIYKLNGGKWEGIEAPNHIRN
jgi:hypothetical protein